MLAEILVLNKSDIRPSRKLVDDLDADSIAFLELTYRLRRDFGLRVPEAKVDEETLRLPLLEGLQRLEQAIGGTTLFEFMKLEAMHDDGHDPELRARSIEVLRQSLRESAFAETLKTAVAGDAATRRRRPGRRPPAPPAAPDAGAERDGRGAPRRATPRWPNACGRWTGWPRRRLRGAGPPDEASLGFLWRDAAGMDRAAAELGALKVKQLAYLMGTDIPEGKEPGAPIATLELRDMFRFITVEAYVRYVLHLAASAAAGRAGRRGRRRRDQRGGRGLAPRAMTSARGRPAILDPCGSPVAPRAAGAVPLGPAGPPTRGCGRARARPDGDPARARRGRHARRAAPVAVGDPDHIGSLRTTRGEPPGAGGRVDVARAGSGSISRSRTPATGCWRWPSRRREPRSARRTRPPDHALSLAARIAGDGRHRRQRRDAPRHPHRLRAPGGAIEPLARAVRAAISDRLRQLHHDARCRRPRTAP